MKAQLRALVDVRAHWLQYEILVPSPSLWENCKSDCMILCLQPRRMTILRRKGKEENVLADAWVSKGNG